MMLLPNPGVLDSLIRDRQATLRSSLTRPPAPAGAALRVFIGHALIVAGLTLSGERAEQSARTSALCRAA